MLSSIKEKLTSVQDEIVSSLNTDVAGHKSDCNEYLAGACLLHKYQEDWQDIHALSEQNGSQAKAADQQIEDAYKCLKHGWQTFRKFNNAVVDLNTIVILAEKAVNAIGNIRTLIEDIHQNIVHVEDLIEEDRQTRAISVAMDWLTGYHKEKLKSLDALRENLGANYQVKQKLIDEEKEDIKRKNFELAEKKFLEDLNAYKKCGVLPKRENIGHELQSIEDVKIEQDLDSLRKYLDQL